jgi:hypothetical protein
VIPSRWSSALEILRRRQHRVDEDSERLRQQCPGALLAPERDHEHVAATTVGDAGEEPARRAASEPVAAGAAPAHGPP